MPKIFENKGYYRRVTIFLILIMSCIFLVTRWVRDVSNEVSISTYSGPRIISRKIPKKHTSREKIFCRKRMDPNRAFEVHVFYAGDEEIARYKSNEDEIFDIKGDIPDGKIEFEDATRGSYGFENYRDGKRHGISKEYYSVGRLKKETYYLMGKLQTKRNYFIDGILRQEEDYTDAKRIVSMKEVGVGSVYYRDGSLMYEWRFTYSDQGGYNKSYNREGKLMVAKYFDEQGRLIEK